MCVPKNPAMALVMALVIPVTAQAAEWSAEPRISLLTGYDDNIRLTAADHDSVWETALSPSVRFGAVKENQGLTGDAGLAIRRYAGGTGRESSDALDREDYYFNSIAFHNTLRDSFKVNLDYTQDSTLDSELDQTGNVISDSATREQFSLGPSWSRSLTELTRTDLTYQYSNIDYTDDPGIQNLVGYTYHVASASLVRQLTPRIQGTLSGGYSIYQPDTDFDSDTLSLQAGLSTSFSETLVVSFLVGQRDTTSDSFTAAGFCIGAAPGATFPSCSGGIPIPAGTADTEIETTSPVYTASIVKQLETGSLSATLSRSSFPGSEGELLDSTRLSLNGNYKLTETLDSSLIIEYTENETIVNRVGIVPIRDKENETFFRITPKVVWHWRREWELAGNYQYARNEDANQNEASRNALYLTLSYLPGKHYVSR
jgi:hypothetical protein